MEHANIPKLLLEWMEEFIEKPHPLLGNWSPCPYARQARIKNSIKILMGNTPLQDGIDTVKHDLWHKDVVIFYYDLTQWPYQEFAKAADQMNEFLKPHGMISLEDHPDDKEEVNGISMNFGPAALLIVQEAKKLNDAAAALYQKGYYNNWSKEYFDRVFANRPNPAVTNHEICQD
jgi:hypothetical protein